MTPDCGAMADPLRVTKRSTAGVNYCLGWPRPWPPCAPQCITGRTSDRWLSLWRVREQRIELGSARLVLVLCLCSHGWPCTGKVPPHSYAPSTVKEQPFCFTAVGWTKCGRAPRSRAAVVKAGGASVVSIWWANWIARIQTRCFMPQRSVDVINSWYVSELCCCCGEVLNVPTCTSACQLFYHPTSVELLLTRVAWIALFSFVALFLLGSWK